MINLMVFGLRGSGKDTFVDHLTQNRNYSKLRLASYVEHACKAFGIKKPTKSDLVFVGTEIGREMIDPDVWINMAIEDIKKHINFYEQYEVKDCGVIVSDVRFHNEYERLLAAGFFPVFIESDREICIKRVIERDGDIDHSLLSHKTETNSKDFFGYKIQNNGSLDELYQRIDFLMHQLKDKTFYMQQMNLFKELYAGKVGKIE